MLDLQNSISHLTLNTPAFNVWSFIRYISVLPLVSLTESLRVVFNGISRSTLMTYFVCILSSLMITSLMLYSAGTSFFVLRITTSLVSLSIICESKSDPVIKRTNEKNILKYALILLFPYEILHFVQDI